MKAKFTFVLIFLLSTFFMVSNSWSQGCVAIRGGMGCSGISVGGNNLVSLSKGQWQASLGYRYFKSFRHFRGSHEETERVANKTEVINYSHTADVGLSYGLTKRFSLNINLPVNFYDRSSLYEHYGNSVEANPQQKRFHTDASGIGDLRVSGTYWLFDPEKHGTGNLSLGLGVKAPTGNSNVQDDFHKLDENKQDYTVRRAVDQSIQLGDGGWGFNVEVQGFQSILPRLSAYFTGFYLFNPRNTNETLTRGTLNNVDPIIAYHSVADQFSARLGLSYVLLPQSNFVLNLGGRIEGVPAKDLIGDDQGFRRPGYVMSVEPGIFYAYKDAVLSLSVPVALYRNRVKSVYDLADATGKRHGDAAFADYLISTSVAYRFGGKHTMKPDSMFKDVPAK